MSNLPKGWEKVFLKEVVQDMHQGINTVTENIEYYDNGIDILQAKHITSGYIDLSDPKKVSIEDYNKYKAKYQPQINHILLTNIGTIGKVLIVEENIDFLIAWNIFLIKSNQLKINPHFLFYVLKKYDIDKFYDKFLTGNATKFINKKFMGDIEIPLPPLEEQKKIADILSTVDKKIAFVEENINATEELKKGLMQKLLTEGIGHTEFKNSELGRIPESWEVNEFGKISDILDPHPSHRAPKEDSNGYPFVGIGDISENGIINLQSSRKVSIEDIKEQNSNISINENDIGFGRVATVGKVIKFRGDYSFPFALSPTMAVIKVKDIEYEYFYQYLTSTMTKKQFKNFTSGSTRISLGIQNLRKLLVLIPPLEEQKQIAEILSTVDKKLENLKEKKLFFQELKKGLMQKLLTGEVRV